MTLSFGFPIDNMGRTRPVAAGSDDSDSNRWERPSRVETEVDYVRIYQPIKSSPLAEEAIWECAAARTDVMLNLLEGMHVCGKGMTITDDFFGWLSLTLRNQTNHPRSADSVYMIDIPLFSVGRSALN